jgi:Cdc6-like AAA superfamily ATPase
LTRADALDKPRKGDLKGGRKARKRDFDDLELYDFYHLPPSDAAAPSSALVIEGPTGCGKTALVHMVSRCMQVQNVQ